MTDPEIIDEQERVVPEPGVVIDTRYEIISCLGRGGMSTVYKAKHLMMGRQVALKILHEHLLVNKEALLRFQRESVYVSALDHPHIVKVFGCGLVNDLPYLVMEFLEGQSLADLLKAEGRLNAERAVPIFIQILDALAYAHEKGIIHRDLKPSNVILLGAEKANENVKLMDFGIAKILPETGKEMQKLTATGHLLGTSLYMSPEQCNAGLIDARSDIYSLGCLMYEMMDGEPPFHGDTPFATIAKQLYDAPKQSKYLKGDLASVILNTLEKDPADRPQSATQLKELLLHPESFPKTKKDTKLGVSASFFPSRSSILWAVLSAIALIGIAGLSTYFGIFSGHKADRQDFSARQHADPSSSAKIKRIQKLAEINGRIEDSTDGHPKEVQLRNDLVTLKELSTEMKTEHNDLQYIIGSYIARIHNVFNAPLKEQEQSLKDCLNYCKNEEDGVQALQATIVYFQLSQLYNRFGLKSKVIEFGTKAFDLTKKYKNSANITRASFLKGYEKLGSQDWRAHPAAICELLASTYLAQGDLEKAASWYREQKNASTSFSSKVRAAILEADTQIKSGHASEARTLIKKLGNEICNSANGQLPRKNTAAAKPEPIEKLLQCLEQIANWESRNGDKETAREFYRQHKILAERAGFAASDEVTLKRN